MSRQPRDYQAEYARRIARGLAQGRSRSQARGHPRPAEPLVRTKTPPFSRQLEEGLKGLRQGKTLTASARAVHISPERLRGYIAATGTATKQRGRWIIGPDNRPRIMRLFSNGENRVVMVTPAEAAEIGRYNSAVGRFLETNDPAPLAPFAGQAVTDITGHTHPFETDPNSLYRLDTTGADSFEDIYRIVN